MDLFIKRKAHGLKGSLLFFLSNPVWIHLKFFFFSGDPCIYLKIFSIHYGLDSVISWVVVEYTDNVVSGQ